MAWLVVAQFALGGCSSRSVSTNSSGGSGGEAGADEPSGGSSTGGNGGGDAGAVSDAGAAGAAGDAGGEASCGMTADCAAGRYCSERGVCTPCTDLTSLEDPTLAKFGEPEPLTTINNSSVDYLFRFPRVFGANGALTYTREYFGGEIWLTGDPLHEVGAPLPSPISELDSIEGSGLWLGHDALGSSNFVFTRAAAPGEKNTLYAAELNGSGMASNVIRLPAPYNAEEPSTESSYSMAVSRDRAWWMVNRDSMFDVQLHTAPLDGSAPPSVVVLQLAEDCNLFDFDFTVWITPDGELLFATVTERDASCATLPSQRTDVVAFRLGPGGLPLGPGIKMPGLSQPEVSEADASLSTDMCWLYFSAEQESGRMGLMRARRDG